MRKTIKGMLRKRVRFLELKNGLLEENYNRLHEVYGENARLYHDMAHHLQMIYYLAQKGGNTDIMDYVASISEPMSRLSDIIWSGVDIVDAILNHAIAQAGALGIVMDVNAEFPRQSTVAADDLCVILFNLLDNAIENTRDAVKGCTSGAEAPVISVAIRKIEKFLVVKVQNPCCKMPKKRFGRIFTTKEDTVRHGIGLQNVRQTAEKYGGNVEMEVREGQFVTTVLLFLDDPGAKEL